MNKRAFAWIVITFLSSNASLALAFEQCGRAAWTPVSIRYTYTQNLSRLHGYYPKELTEGINQQFSFTPEEAGHYILGQSDFSYRYQPTFTETVPTTAADSTRVLVSTARVVHIQETQIVPAHNNHPPRIDDSQDIPKVIEQHPWDIPAFNK
jgi:hypothetical protein